MELIVVADPETLAESIADRIAATIASAPATVLGVATGSSPLGVYRALARRVAGGLDVANLRAFALDEYVGISPDDPRSYAATLRTAFARPLGLSPSALHVPDGTRPDLDEACADYERAIADAGGVDIQLAGFGANGHLAFNEPGSPADSVTRVVDLAARTRSDNARFFDHPDEVPHQAITQGVGTILRARSIIAVATGSTKAEAVAAAVAGPIDAACPASFLRLHEDAVVYADPAAAALLP
ncbi:glucosamine-6-phosphate deaminase [Leifsonia sp. ZF2019]|uniref:glucosamine-6-phosphate deaminase n=1 Tax=Leifsonia sp. ZF2019 TaxID=2781978 RepID=UPI001CC11754|nr:glucosamine-6-phosphate deaminase [Leifsonia sp. ZF2019]UAJ79828.1 glucosamine-6-phosphate deaminase [Leifsonia sp. ZF2019]